jgi:hypothetical protein
VTDADVGEVSPRRSTAWGGIKRRPATGKIEFNPEPLHCRNSGYTAPHRHYQLGAAERAITSLEPLKGLTNLSKLYLNDAKGIKSLEPLTRSSNLWRVRRTPDDHEFRRAMSGAALSESSELGYFW